MATKEGGKRRFKKECEECISKRRKLKTRGTGADIDTNGVMASVTVWGREGEHAFKERGT